MFYKVLTYWLNVFLCICFSAVDLLPTHIYIDPPSKHNVIYSQQDTDFHFSFEVIKGTANNPTQFKYLAMISLDGDIDNPTNRNLTIQSHNLAHGNDVTCMLP